jgi:hypothetical protein
VALEEVVIGMFLLLSLDLSTRLRLRRAKPACCTKGPLRDTTSLEGFNVFVGSRSASLRLSREAVIVARFEEPAKSMLRGGPEHKVQCRFAAERVPCHSIGPRMYPLRADAEHKFHFF